MPVTLPTLPGEVSRKSIAEFAGDLAAVDAMNYLVPAIGTTCPRPVQCPLPRRS